jgi:hypothetical protein
MLINRLNQVFEDAVQFTEARNSDAIVADGLKTIAIQVLATEVQALTAATVTLQCSIDDGETYHAVGSAENITEDSAFLFTLVDPPAGKYRLAYALDAGELLVTSRVLGKAEV